MTGPRDEPRPLRPIEFDPAATSPLPPELREEGEAEGGGVPVPVETAALVRRRWPARLFAWGAGGLLATALGFDLAALLGQAWLLDPRLGGAVATLILLAAGGLIGLVVGELRSLGRIVRIDGLRERAGRHEPGAAEAVATLYRRRADMAPALAAFDRHLSDALSPEEALSLAERTLLQPLDRRAYRLVLTAARDTAVATALSPAALLDALVVAWRNLRLVRELATLYGARPGWLGSMRLLRRMLANLAVAGLADSGSDLAVDAIGGTLAASLSARVGQGLLNGMLTARVGVVAMHLCRPMPFAATERPGLRAIRRELLRVPKQVL
jgi:putative membrane protein